MMKQQHTPGPWKILPEEAGKDYIRIRGTVLGCRHKIANVPTPVYEGVHPREVGETRANAALIAAAPELLAALEAMCRWQDGTALPPSRSAVEAIIAKARNQ